MKDTDWNLIRELHKTRSITRTAEELYISQPALTKRLRVIEKELDVIIAERTSQGLQFTAAGTLLAERAEEFLDLTENVKKELEAIKKSEEKMRLGAPYSFTSRLMTELLFPYTKEKNLCTYEVSSGTSDQLMESLRSGELDAVFVRGDYEWKKERLLVECGQAVLMTKDPVAIENLPNLQRIDYRTNRPSLELMERWWERTFHTDYPAGIPAGNYLDVAWEMAAQGAGYCICFPPENFRNTYGLTVTPLFLPDGTPVMRNTWLYYRRERCNANLKGFIAYTEAAR